MAWTFEVYELLVAERMAEAQLEAQRSSLIAQVSGSRDAAEATDTNSVRRTPTGLLARPVLLLLGLRR